MHTSGNHDAPPSDDEIAVCAYLIWKKEGCPAGRDVEIWYQARIQLEAMRAHDQWIGKTKQEAPSAGN